MRAPYSHDPPQVQGQLGLIDMLVLAFGVVPVLHPAAEVDLVGGLQVPEIVEIEPVGLPVPPGRYEHLSCRALGLEMAARAVSGQAAPRIVGESPGIHHRAGEVSHHAVLAILELEIEIEAGGIGIARGEVAVGRAVGAPERRGLHDVETISPLGELLAEARDEVARSLISALEEVVGLALSGHVGGCGERGHRNVGLRLAGEFGRVTDAGVGVAGPDPPRIEHREDRLLEEPAPFDKERALLLEEGLEGGEVELGRVGLHLAEVGLQGTVQGEVGGDAVLEVRSEVSESVDAVLAARSDRVGSAPHRVGEDLELARRGDVLQAHEGAEPAHEPALLAVPRHPRRVLAAAMHIAVDLQPPGIEAGAVPDGRERDADLRVPAARVLGHLALPHRIPVVVALAVVIHIGVGLHAQRVHPEVVAGAAVVIRVDVDAHQIRVAELVAPGELLADLRRVLLRTGDREVDRILVVSDLEDGLLGGRLAAIRLPHRESRRPFRLEPDRVVQLAVDRDALAARKRVGANRRRADEAAVRGRRVLRIVAGRLERVERRGCGACRRESHREERERENAGDASRYRRGAGSVSSRVSAAEVAHGHISPQWDGGL